MHFSMATPVPIPFDPSASSESAIETAAPRITLRNAFAHPFDSAIAAARTCYSPRLIGPEEITEKQRVNIGAATFYGGHHTVYPARAFRIWPRKYQPPIRLVVPARASFLQLRAAKPALRAPRSRAGLRSTRQPEFRRRRTAIYERAVARAWDLYRELTRLLQARRARNSRRHLAHQRDVASEAPGKSRAPSRKARHRSGALRVARRRLHHHGAHAFRHRAAPPLAHAGGVRHAH